MLKPHFLQKQRLKFSTLVSTEGFALVEKNRLRKQSFRSLHSNAGRKVLPEKAINFDKPRFLNFQPHHKYWFDFFYQTLSLKYRILEGLLKKRHRIRH